MRSDGRFTHTRHLGRSRAVAGLALATLAPALALGVGLGAATAPAAHAAPANCTVGLVTTTCTFGATNAPQSWTVPAGVDRATFTLIGGGGGWSPYTKGGSPGGTVATITTAPGQVLQLFVGGAGDRFRGGWNGGADSGGWPAGGGGGSSDVRFAPYTTLNRILVAGGGGGAGAYAGGLDNGAPGSGGNGGGASSPGLPGQNASGYEGAGGGGGASTSNVGSPGVSRSVKKGCQANQPGTGTWGLGGVGGSVSGEVQGYPCDDFGGVGGGGGGGWFGGGGGGAGRGAGAGGGGGAGFGPAGSTSFTPDPGTRGGSITVSYRTPSSDWTDLAGGGQLTSAPTAVLRPGTTTQDVFYRNANGNVIQRLVTDGAPGPEINHGAVLYPGSTIAAAWRGDGTRLELFGRGTENALWRKSYTVTQGWTGWTAVTPAGTLTSSPTVTWVNNTRLEVLFRGNDNLLKQMNTVNGTWTAPKTLHAGATLDTAPSAVVTDPVSGRVEVYAGCNGSLCRWAYTSGGNIVDFGHILGSSLATAPTAAASPAGHVQITVRNSADRLILWQNRNGAWTQTDLGPTPSPVGSSIGQAPMSATNTILYARSTQGTLIGRTITP